MKSSGANLHSRSPTHKQDTLSTLHGIVRPGDFFLMWDLKDMFHQIQVHKSMRRMLRALLRIPTADLKAWKKTVAKIEKLCKTTLEGDKTALRIQNTTLSQGLSPSPGIATKMMADVLRLIRKCGVRVAIKVDDIICTATGLQEAMRAGYIISLLLTKLGAIFSPKNSLYPCVQVDWCGARICSVVAGVTMQLPEKLGIIQQNLWPR